MKSYEVRYAKNSVDRRLGWAMSLVGIAHYVWLTRPAPVADRYIVML